MTRTVTSNLKLPRQTKLILFLSLFFSILPQLSAAELEIRLFGSTGCEQCERVQHGIVQEARSLYPQIKYSKTLIDDVEGFKQLLALEEKFGDDRNESVKVFIGYFPHSVQVLAGVAEIEQHLIEQCIQFVDITSQKKLTSASFSADHHGTVAINKSSLTSEETSSSLSFARQRVDQFTLWAVISAGFIDGINPCVFSTLVFFMSLLAASQVTGRRLLSVGLSFCFGSFVMYTTMGFGLLQIMRSFWGFSIMQTSMQLIVVAVLGWFAFDSFRSAYRFSKNNLNIGDSCNLPLGIVGKIHRAIRQGIGTKNLVAGAFGCGLVVTAFESICTGQVYVPTLVLIIQSDPTPILSWFYLLLFNISCITPLLLIFIMVYRGVRFEVFETWTKKNVRSSKILLGTFFIIMGLLIVLI